MSIFKPSEKWQNRNAIAFSPHNKRFGSELRPILAKRNWKIPRTVDSLDEAFQGIISGEGSLLILDDDHFSPVCDSMRLLLFHPILCLTPTIITLSEDHQSLTESLRTMGDPAIVHRPSTPEKLLQAFDQLTDQWSLGDYVILRQAAQKFARDQKKAAYSLLVKAFKKPRSIPITATAISLFYRSQNNFKMTEKVLVSVLKKHPYQLSAIFPLIDLYLYGCLPEQALTLCRQVQRRYNTPKFIIPDTIQSLLMLNQIQETIPYFRFLQKIDYFADEARTFLPRLLYATGQWDEFDKAINYRVEKFDRYQKAWHILTTEAANKRKQQYQQMTMTKDTATPAEKKTPEKNMFQTQKPLFSEF